MVESMQHNRRVKPFDGNSIAHADNYTKESA
jgi:hypothetical protein